MSKRRDEPSQETRISDRERDGAVAKLRFASAEGQISLDEFSDRSKLAYRAQYRHELQALFRDLPATAGHDETDLASPTTVKRKWLMHVAGASNRTGEWKPGQPITAVSILSTQSIDLSHAETDRISVTAFTLFGTVEIIVRSGTVVDISGFTLIGGIKDQLTQHPRAKALASVRAWGLLGRCLVRNPAGPPSLAPPPPRH